MRRGSDLPEGSLDSREIIFIDDTVLVYVGQLVCASLSASSGGVMYIQKIHAVDDTIEVDICRLDRLHSAEPGEVRVDCQPAVFGLAQFGLPVGDELSDVAAAGVVKRDGDSRR